MHALSQPFTGGSSALATTSDGKWVARIPAEWDDEGTAVPARWLTLVEVASTKPEVPGVKNLKLAIAADKKSAVVSGEWANPSANKGGADALIPLKLTEERAGARAASMMQATGILQLGNDRKATATIPLPPLSANLDGISRKIDVEVRQIGANGKVFVLASGTLVGRGPVEIAAKQVYSPPTAAVTAARTR